MQAIEMQTSLNRKRHLIMQQTREPVILLENQLNGKENRGAVAIAILPKQAMIRLERKA